MDRTRASKEGEKSKQCTQSAVTSSAFLIDHAEISSVEESMAWQSRLSARKKRRREKERGCSWRQVGGSFQLDSGGVRVYASGCRLPYAFTQRLVPPSCFESCGRFWSYRITVSTCPDDGLGRVRSASDEQSLFKGGFIPLKRSWRLIWEARRTLNCRRVIKWSEERGNMTFATGSSIAWFGMVDLEGSSAFLVV